MKTFLKICFSIMVCTMSFIALGQLDQPIPPRDFDEETGQQQDPGIPLDGGLSALLAAGAGLGGRKLYKEYKKRK